MGLRGTCPAVIWLPDNNLGVTFGETFLERHPRLSEVPAFEGQQVEPGTQEGVTVLWVEVASAGLPCVGGIVCPVCSYSRPWFPLIIVLSR